MLLTIEKVLILKSVPLFATVQEQQLVEIASLIEQVDYPKDAVVMEVGDLGSSMYIVVEGRVRVYRGDTELRILGSRAVFGELSALDPEPRSASVQTLEDSTLLRLEGETLYELMLVNKELTRGIIHVLCSYARTNLVMNKEGGS